MTIIYRGIKRDVTDLLSDYGQAHYAQNLTFGILGEIGRRAGMGKSTMAKLDGPVVLLSAGWADEPFIVQITTTGSVVGTRDPNIYWGGGGGGGGGGPRKPLIPDPPPPACTVADPQSFSGNDSQTVTKNLVANSCAGTVTMTGIGSLERSWDLGFLFYVDVDGINAYVSPYLADDSVIFNYPAGALTIDVHVTDSEALPDGSWTVDIT